MLKINSEELFGVLIKIINSYFNDQVFQQLEIAYIAIHKKGNANCKYNTNCNCNNYGRISVIGTLNRLYERILYDLIEKDNIISIKKKNKMNSELKDPLCAMYSV